MSNHRADASDRPAATRAKETRIELLAPARDEATARAAIQCGADAVYIGAPRFSAREAAGNSIASITEVVAFAHPYYARVYVALNTLLRDDELPEAEKMIHALYQAGIDGLIVQDTGLLELDLPPMPLVASTQMDNATPEKVKFWQDVGISRVILARELTLEQIRNIRRQTSMELECFVHGALCVGASGQCYMSYATGRRSGNRGQCAQPCRKHYTLKDRRGKTIARGRHLLSLKDLNLSDHLEALIDAGITSFKIEGRLKDVPYVANTVGFYRQKLDTLLAKKHLARSSSGSVQLNFQPDPARTFNRGFTDYGLTGSASGISAMDSPKSMGEFIGTVAKVDGPCFTLAPPHALHNADGICFFDAQRSLTGTVVNRVEGAHVYPQTMRDIRIGQQIYRNNDRLFSAQLADRAARRTIALTLVLRDAPDGLALLGIDEDGNEATVVIPGPWQPAEKEEAARRTTLTQLARLGNTIFARTEVRLETREVYFLPVSRLNAARRELVAQLLCVRERNRPRLAGKVLQNTCPYPRKRLNYRGNVLNARAEAFYRRHGVETIEPAAESGLEMAGRLVMTTKLCLRRELDLCSGTQARGVTEPWVLQDEDGRQYEVHFQCGPCGMDIYLPPKKNGPPAKCGRAG
ncbi:MAG: U32 family peptidase [Phycisphaerales bacterium]|nr:MAG: U32 family peptidase [Phycisphaerales bacterium]